jgi:hypothetical protein
MAAHAARGLWKWDQSETHSAADLWSSAVISVTAIDDSDYISSP